jgi:hypothetical protein
VLVGNAGWWRDPLSTHGVTDALRDAELVAAVAGAALERATGIARRPVRDVLGAQPTPRIARSHHRVRDRGRCGRRSRSSVRDLTTPRSRRSPAANSGHSTTPRLSFLTNSSEVCNSSKVCGWLCCPEVYKREAMARLVVDAEASGGDERSSGVARPGNRSPLYVVASRAVPRDAVSTKVLTGQAPEAFPERDPQRGGQRYQRPGRLRGALVTRRSGGSIPRGGSL